MRKPRVLFLNRVYPPVHGASGRMLRDLARSMARDGWQVTVVTSGARGMVERDGAVRVIRVKGAARPGVGLRGMFGYGFVWFKMVLAALRSGGQQDLVVSLTDPPMLVVVGDLLARFKKAKHLHWCHDVYPDLFDVIGVRMPKVVRGALRRAAYGAMARADKVIVIGRCMARYLAEKGVVPGAMAVVPNWPDAELSVSPGKDVYKGAPHHGEVESSLTKHGAVEGYRAHEAQVKNGPKFRILYAGNIGHAHPVDTILTAAEILHDEHPEIEFVFVGDGPRYDAIAEERSRKHMDNVKLLPYQPARRLRELMESGDVHLVSMKDEALGRLVPSKLYSALAAGRPCVFLGPDDSEVAKVLGDYQAGAVIPQGRPELLAAQIKSLRLDADVWFSAQVGAAKAGAVFTPKASMQAWIDRAWQVLDDPALKRPPKKRAGRKSDDAGKANGQDGKDVAA